MSIYKKIVQSWGNHVFLARPLRNSKANRKGRKEFRKGREESLNGSTHK